MRITNDGAHLLLGGTTDVNEITESSATAGMVIGGTGFGNGGLAIINSTSGTGRIYFGDALGANAGRNRGQINYAHSDDHMRFVTASSERMRIDSSGKLMVGGTTADAKFAVIDSSNPDIAMRYNGTSGGHKTRLMFMNKRGVIHAQVADILHNDNVGTAAADLEFATSTGGTLTARMLIKQDGNTVLDTGGRSFAHLAQFTSTHDGSRFGMAVHNTNGGGGSQIAIRFHRNDSDVGSISTTGSATAYNTSSDYRLKENAVAISDGITRLKTLKPYRFNWKSDPGTTVDGFFAHEVTAVPEAITGTKDEVALADEEQKGIKKGDAIYQSIDQSKLVPLLTAALQEAVTKIETLETKVAVLEAA